MNYQILKNIIDNLLNSFTCPSCTCAISEADIEIVGAAWNTINVNVSCPQCQKNAMIRTEVAHVNLDNINPANIPADIQNKIQALKWDILKVGTVKKTTINDKQITELNRDLKNISGVTDLFGES